MNNDKKMSLELYFIVNVERTEMFVKTNNMSVNIYVSHRTEEF